MTWILKIFSNDVKIDPETRRFRSQGELAAFLKIASLDDVCLIIIYPEGDKRDVCMPILR